MKTTKSSIAVLLILIVTCISTSCKKEKLKVQTQLPSNYSNQGTITVANKNISICVYDNNAEDGDIIDLIFNGNALIKNYELKNAERCFNATLEKGDNWIGIIAIDEGTTSPATVTVKINDGVTEQEFDIDGEVNKPGGYIIKL